LFNLTQKKAMMFVVGGFQASRGSINYGGARRKTNPTVLVNPMRKIPFSCAPMHFGVEGGGKAGAGNEMLKGIEEFGTSI
jgi:hypothetical protein